MDSKIILATKIFSKKNKQIVSICSTQTYKFDRNDINGSLYLSPTKVLKKFKNFTKKDFIPLRMSSYLENIDIDTKDDFQKATSLIRNGTKLFL
jgi:CMP-N-acetylneuraminic acid synthetase